MPPWESFPEGDGIHYVEKFSDDPGMEPIYLAKMTYEDKAALLRVVTHFGIEPHTSLAPPEGLVGFQKPAPPWFPLQGVTKLYIRQTGPSQYNANLWVNETTQTMILERSWY